MIHMPERKLKEGGCPGSGSKPRADTLLTYRPSSWYKYSGLCPVCGYRYGITRVDGVMVRHLSRSQKV